MGTMGDEQKSTLFVATLVFLLGITGAILETYIEVARIHHGGAR